MEEVSNMLEFLAEMIKKGLLTRSIDILLILEYNKQNTLKIKDFIQFKTVTFDPLLVDNSITFWNTLE
jgi:hypothetical protein